MPIALDPKATFEYVLQCDRDLPADQQTKFLLRGLTVAEEAKVSDSLLSTQTGSDELNLRAGTHQLTVLRAGLRGWTNFVDVDGNPVEFEWSKGHPKRVTDDCLDRLLPAWRAELMNAVLERATVTPEEGN